MPLCNYTRFLPALIALVLTTRAHAVPAPFDLAGPSLEVSVTRAAVTLPISEVPSLASGDRIWIKPDLPESQSERYLLVLAFLRGSTNPPPESWLFRCETWRPKCSHDGLTVTVPEGAQQVLVFLAPQTGGDFKTLLNAAQGRPGAFVRASQDLNQATLDRSRLERYLAAVRKLNASEPGRLRDASLLLARSLAIRVNEKCLDKIPELQAPCLTDGQEALILNDGHSTSIVEALTSGPASDLALQASFTPELRYGYYSPYIASILDIARIFSSFTTTQFQYIPALASLQGAHVALTLNTPPSFHTPKSVLVAALPAIEQPQLPPLHAVDPKETYCARKTALVLPVEGAPLVFSSGYAHDVVLRVSTSDGRNIDLPAIADAEQGGFVIDTSALKSASLTDSVRGSLRGYWGFESFDGPGFQLANARAQTWELADGETGAVTVGREGTVHLRASSASCVDGIMLKDPNGKELKADWKMVRPNEVEVKLPLEQAAPGSLTLLLQQYGGTAPQPLNLHAFAEAGHLSGFTVHAGDTTGVLRGTRLDEVTALLVQGLGFAPTQLTTTPTGDELTMSAVATKTAPSLRQADAVTARVTLKDGRVLDLKTSIEPPRPSAKLLGKSMQLAKSSTESNIRLVSEDQVPQDATLRFSVRAQNPAAFVHDEQIELATDDESFSTVLSLANGGITLENAKVAVATFAPAKSFGTSAFGPLKFRVTVKGSAGDWQPLATLVRLPALEDLKCAPSPELACMLSGANLFLLDSVSGSAQFEHPTQVPDGFPGYALPVPKPVNGQLYVKLRDDPSVINVAALGPQLLPPSPSDAARAAGSVGGPAGGATPAATAAAPTPPSTPQQSPPQIPPTQ